LSVRLQCRSQHCLDVNVRTVKETIKAGAKMLSLIHN
jgi:hypothetical protein